MLTCQLSQNKPASILGAAPNISLSPQNPKHVIETENVLFVKVPKMDKCRIGNLCGNDCGSATVKGTVFTEYQALSDCQRDITRHFYTLKVRESKVSPEKEPILHRVDKKK